MRVNLKGKFLGTDNYYKKDENGNQTNEQVKVISVFDGKDLIKVTGVDGSALKFGDDVSLICEIYPYRDRPGMWLKVCSS